MVRGLGGAMLALALLAGCAAPHPRPQAPPAAGADGVREALAVPEADAGGQVPEAVAQALLPPVRVQLPEAESSPEPRFDIEVHDAPAKAFFMGLVRGTPWNMVVHPAVEGSISLELKNVTVPEVLRVVRDVYGYDFRRTATGFEVYPARLSTRIFHVGYPDVVRRGESRTRVSSGQVSQGARSEDGGAGSTPEEVTGSSVRTETQSDFWRELEAAVRALVGGGDGRSVVASPQTGLLVVRAMPGELRDVEAYLEKARLALSRQVILEAKIVEVELADGFQSGINWAALLGGGDHFLVGQTGGGRALAEGRSVIAGQEGNLDPLDFSAVAGNLAEAFGGVLTFAARFDDFTAFLELLETQGRVRVLSSPRVATVNNQKAVIKVGSDEFFVTDVSTTTVTGTTTTTTPDVTLTPFFSGIALDVTPEIDEEGGIVLHIHPTVSEVSDQIKTITIGGETQTLPLAVSRVREADSVVRARSGQVVVIGGLMRESSTDDRAATPVLGRLPGVGALFRHRRSEARKSELVILLRPVVVDPEGRVWREAIGESARRVEGMDGR
ncbi:pilus (MSHA type) biogenesis protein MshL [Inmirania thermothiophila]|uniref:MSHA biogenesis protein MshL n=1 Tax=Inmirania thermothiophila TaxID=1750597 RepID=A0A3N1Y5W6_9GAMM|nr:pilus (MSHA type) biogenesis protein MshL [Inmirania thermothiophila]ROR34206.1 MSHA biogenesis protein MshL [Inmirania thermothiophila]